MLSFNKKIILFLLIAGKTFAQDCTYTVSGKILDELTKSPMAFASVYIEENQRGIIADEFGNFKIENICESEIHIRVTHASCEPVRVFVDLRVKQTYQFSLNHHNELLNEIQVHGKSGDRSTQVSSSISSVEIAKSGNQNLADILEKITGVSTLKNGSGISKPIIQGLFGNRISILNDGIAQSGQQWGNDHAPEIDPFNADHLSVVKGVNALQYAGSTLGGVVLVESSPIAEEPHLHGSAKYIYNSNGRGNTVNLKVEKANRSFRWRLNTTAKLQGDTHAPNYILTNTGRREGNAALRLEKTFGQKWSSTLSLSTFNSEVGILRGSQIGNLTDLELAFQQEIPFFTEENFSYQINPPKQRVGHHAVKLETVGVLPNNQTLKFVYGGQLNNRREFDVRRGGRSDIPVLSLNQFSHFFEETYFKDFSGGKTLRIGLQQLITDNTNVPETGILPLIPDYFSFQNSLFTIFNIDNKKWYHEFGIRLENKQLNAVTITRDFPRAIERINQNFTFFSVSAGSELNVSNQLRINANVGIAMRPPEVNELFSFGLHQGVSSIEEGNPDLMPEQSAKALFTVNFHQDNKLLFEITPYAQLIRNFIYLQPRSEFLLTIRGAFPYFKFEQADALLVGTDALVSFEPTDKLKWINKFSFVRGENLSEKIPLINMPPLNFSTSIQVVLNDFSYFTNNTFELEVNHTARQKNLLETQDFILPPNAFTLLNASYNSEIPLGKYFLSLGIKAENILNVSYRNYLNRLRYFADDAGRNITVSAVMTF
ncbi:MAG: TonB-dependent receptor [Spirosomaceae bacterium]|nr:TonB-dependent receptor [Spirosomataceae bacterium]